MVAYAWINREHESVDRYLLRFYIYIFFNDACPGGLLTQFYWVLLCMFVQVSGGAAPDLMNVNGAGGAGKKSGYVKTKIEDREKELQDKQEEAKKVLKVSVSSYTLDVCLFAQPFCVFF